jgi:WW domain-binding protein 11
MVPEGPPPRRASFSPGPGAPGLSVPHSTPLGTQTRKYLSHIPFAPNQPINHQQRIAEPPAIPQLGGRLWGASKSDLPRGHAPMPPRSPPPRGPPPRGPPPLPHGPPGYYLGRPSVLGKI